MNHEPCLSILRITGMSSTWRGSLKKPAICKKCCLFDPTRFRWVLLLHIFYLGRMLHPFKPSGKCTGKIKILSFKVLLNLVQVYIHIYTYLHICVCMESVCIIIHMYSRWKKCTHTYTHLDWTVWASVSVPRFRGKSHDSSCQKQERNRRCSNGCRNRSAGKQRSGTAWSTVSTRFFSNRYRWLIRPPFHWLAIASERTG